MCLIHFQDYLVKNSPASRSYVVYIWFLTGEMTERKLTIGGRKLSPAPSGKLGRHTQDGEEMMRAAAVEKKSEE